jgi:CRISPR-associated protein Cmr5
MMTTEQPKPNKPSLEQKRAQDAWNCSLDGKKNLPKYSDYINAAKSLPALIMNSGLMQVMAFMHEKAKKADGKRYELLEGHLRAWLQTQCKTPPDFEGFMKELMEMPDPRRFQAITTEAFAWLKWLRQIAPALKD